ncbi:MAG: hypothetical protein C4K60_08220 [Ideonella sp. MAG2]|nr:MAG: hypothetical protein C4K60_08220 [Ideonella sp. MAG2]
MLTGCSSFVKQPATPELVSQLRGQPLAKTVGDPKFRFLTSQDGVKSALVSVFTGGIVGGVVMNDSAVTKGKELSDLGGLTDPGRKVADALVARLKVAVQVLPLEPSGVVEPAELNHILQVAPRDSAFVLDVRTLSWGGSYLPTQWDRYRLTYALKARLIDRARQVVVAEGFCNYLNRSESNPPSYDELVANRAALLKQRLEAYAAECAQEAWSQMFPESSLQMPMVSASKPEPAAVAEPPPSAAPVAAAAQPSREGVEAVATVAAAVPQTQSLPTLSLQAERRYQVFLTKPNPKAFALAGNGESWMAWGESLNPMVTETVPQRALRACEERSRARCKLYAVDGKVVWGHEREGRK